MQYSKNSIKNNSQNPHDRVHHHQHHCRDGDVGIIFLFARSTE